MSCLLETLTVLKKAKRPLRARSIGSQCDPIYSLNTVIKNIHFLREEFGQDLILDDSGTGARESREKSYWFNRNYLLQNNYSNTITPENREKLNQIILSDNTDISFPKKISTHIKKCIIADALTLSEMIIINNYIRDQEESNAVRILNELVQYRVCTDTTSVAGMRLHEEPFSYVPSKLMKKIDRVSINQLCTQEV